MKWTTEDVTTDRPLTSNTDAQWRNGDVPDFWVWHLSSVRLKLWLSFPLGCIKSCMCTAKFIWVFSFSFMVYGNLATILFYLWLHWWRARKCNRAFLFIITFYWTFSYLLSKMPSCKKHEKTHFDCPHIPKLCYASLKCPVLMPARLLPLSSICFFFPHPSPFRCYALLSSSSSSSSLFLSLILLLARTRLL